MDKWDLNLHIEREIFKKVEMGLFFGDFMTW